MGCVWVPHSSRPHRDGWGLVLWVAHPSAASSWKGGLSFAVANDRLPRRFSNVVIPTEAAHSLTVSGAAEGPPHLLAFRSSFWRSQNLCRCLFLFTRHSGATHKASSFWRSQNLRLCPCPFVCHSRSRGPRRASLLVGVRRESAVEFFVRHSGAARISVFFICGVSRCCAIRRLTYDNYRPRVAGCWEKNKRVLVARTATATHFTRGWHWARLHGTIYVDRELSLRPGNRQIPRLRPTSPARLSLRSCFVTAWQSSYWVGIQSRSAGGTRLGASEKPICSFPPWPGMPSR
jgi:hypothetical protein